MLCKSIKKMYVKKRKIYMVFFSLHNSSISSSLFLEYLILITKIYHSDKSKKFDQYYRIISLFLDRNSNIYESKMIRHSV